MNHPTLSGWDVLFLAHLGSLFAYSLLRANSCFARKDAKKSKRSLPAAAGRPDSRQTGFLPLLISNAQRRLKNVEVGKLALGVTRLVRRGASGEFIISPKKFSF